LSASRWSGSQRGRRVDIARRSQLGVGKVRSRSRDERAFAGWTGKLGAGRDFMVGDELRVVRSALT
jgi:hypothetical protein